MLLPAIPSVVKKVTLQNIIFITKMNNNFEIYNLCYLVYIIFNRIIPSVFIDSRNYLPMIIIGNRQIPKTNHHIKLLYIFTSAYEFTMFCLSRILSLWALHRTSRCSRRLFLKLIETNTKRSIKII